MPAHISIFQCFPNKSRGTCHYCTRRATQVCAFPVEGTDGDGRQAPGTCDRPVCGQCAKERSGFAYCNFHAMQKSLDKNLSKL